MQYMKSNDAILQNHSASLKTLETQMEQLAAALNNRPQWTLPSNTEANPRGSVVQCQAFNLRSGKILRNDTLPTPLSKMKKNERVDQQENVQPYRPPMPFSQRL